MTSLTLSKSDVTNRATSALTTLTNLTAFYAENIPERPFDDAGCAQIATLTNLTTLAINRNYGITDEGILLPIDNN